MARDRLAAMRGGSNYGGDNSYPTPAQPRSQYRNESYEMSNTANSGYGNSNGGYGDSNAGYGNTGASNDVYGERERIAGRIEQFTRNVERIRGLQARQNQRNLDPNADGGDELKRLRAGVRADAQEIKDEIQSFKRRFPGTMDQVTFLKDKFERALQDFRTEENMSSQQYKDGIKRQLKIVRPDYDEGQLDQAVEQAERDGGQIFSQAVVRGQNQAAQSAYRNAQQRSEEMRQITQTLAELAQLFNDMSLLVNEQDEQIQDISQKAFDAQDQVEKGQLETTKARNSAKAARKKRWICFWIMVLILIIVAAIVVAVVETNKKS